MVVHIGIVLTVSARCVLPALFPTLFPCQCRCVVLLCFYLQFSHSLRDARCNCSSDSALAADALVSPEDAMCDSGRITPDATGRSPPRPSGVSELRAPTRQKSLPSAADWITSADRVRKLPVMSSAGAARSTMPLTPVGA